MAKTWIRMYCATLDNPKISQLSDRLFRFWIKILLVSARFREDGTLPPVTDIAFAVRQSEATVSDLLNGLIDLGLLDRCATALKIHDWDTWQYSSDVSTQRVKQLRAKRSSNVAGNVSVTASDTHQNRTEQSRTEAENVSPLLDDTFERCYAASVKRTQRGIAERYFVAAAERLDPALIEKRWIAQNAKWSADKFAKGVQNFADWLLDRNYQISDESETARVEPEPVWLIEMREAGL